MKRAVVYARVSTERQADEGLSIDSQIEACERRAQALNAAVVAVYRDEGISGTTDARPGFRAAINRCALRDVEYLICWSSSRFARDQHDAITYKRELQAYGTRLVYAQSDVDINTHEGWLLDSMQQVIDENYSRQVSRDTKRSMMSAAADGFWMGGRVPYGFRAVPTADGRRRRMAPHEYEAAVVRQIFGWAADGTGALLIATRLNELGVTLNGRPWRKAAVLYLLKSEAYMGMVIFNRFDRKTRKQKPSTEWVRVPAHEAIVAPELFEKVQAAMGERAPKAEQGSSTSQHVFTGLLRCGRCDGALKIRTGKGRGGVMYSYYGCHNHLQGVRCGLPAFRADQFDSWMTQQLLDRVLTVDVIQGVLDRLDEAASDWVKDRSRRRTALLLELRAAEGRRRKLFEVIEEGGKDAPGIKELGPRLRELNAQIENLERAMVALEAEPEPNVGPLTITAEEAAEIFRSTITASDDPRRRRAVLATITDRIVVNDGSVDVHYKPDCLVSADGLPVRSEHCWLPDLGSNQGPTD
ncbi:MAG: recombinase family protein [Roseateles sp.]